jgi:hypothetical protein
MTAIELGLLWVAFSNLSLSASEGVGMGHVFKWKAVLWLGVLSILGQLDARSRYQNYKQIKDQLLQYGFDKRILRPALKSRCLRDAAQAAADDVGHGDRCRHHFLSCGYRWFHLLPDFAFRRPQFLLTAFFWRTTFFAPAYRSRYR